MEQRTTNGKPKAAPPIKITHVKEPEKIFEEILQLPLLNPKISDEQRKKITVEQAFQAGQINLMLRLKEVYNKYNAKPEPKKKEDTPKIVTGKETDTLQKEKKK